MLLGVDMEQVEEIIKALLKVSISKYILALIILAFSLFINRYVITCN